MTKFRDQSEGMQILLVAVYMLGCLLGVLGLCHARYYYRGEITVAEYREVASWDVYTEYVMRDNKITHSEYAKLKATWVDRQLELSKEAL